MIELRWLHGTTTELQYRLVHYRSKFMTPAGESTTEVIKDWTNVPHVTAEEAPTQSKITSYYAFKAEY